MGTRETILYVCIFGPKTSKVTNLRTLPAVVDLIELVVDDIAFIVMEAWSSQLITGDGPCCLGLFFATLRQCIEVGRSPSSSMCRSLQIKSTAARCLHA